MSQQLQRLLAALNSAGCKITPSDNGYESQCPAHEDHSASLSIGTGADGRILLHCHAGCSTEAILTALHLGMSDLFNPTEDHLTLPPGVLREVEGKIYSQHWTYKDVDGQSLGIVARYEKSGNKTYRPYFRREGGNWLYGYGDGLRPIYNLDALHARPSEIVIVVEGEKAAEALAGRGFLVTTSPGGADSAAKADWSPLAGRQARIWADADEPGERYAQAVAAILRGLQPTTGVDFE